MTDRRKRQPMTKKEAIQNVASMRVETPDNAQLRLIQVALNGYGNLSDDARSVYESRLFELETK